MIKAKIKLKEGSIFSILYIIGLSEMNIKKLVEGCPIVFDCTEIGMPDPGTIMIGYGKTEEDLEAQIKKDFGVQK